MDISNINLVYFSATYTTRKVVRLISKQIGTRLSEYDITQITPVVDVISGQNDLFIVGMPVYAGRIPSLALDGLNRFKGNNTPAIIVCVYGNRDYDDALLEMKDIVENNGFKVISAGAFVAQHSIFPEVGANRPDMEDREKICSFGNKNAAIISDLIDINLLGEIEIKGNKPYKIPGSIPLKPRARRSCNKCGSCVKACPVDAISEAAPRKTNKDLCISCGRCIVVCPQKSRHFGGLLYKIAGNKFVKANFARKEPEVIYAI